MANIHAIALDADSLLAGRLNPKNDFLFKRLFGEKEGKQLLISLLNAILRRGGKQQITDISIADDTHLGSELIGDKEIVLDLLCEIDGSEKVNVEMQVRRFTRMDHRSLYYLATMLADVIDKGGSYSNLKRTIGVNILDHNYLSLPKFHNTFHLYEDEDRHYLLTDILEIHFIECPKFKSIAFDIQDPLHRWLRFLDQKTTDEQLKELMEVDDMIKEAEARLNYLASDERTRRLYAIREKALHDRASWLEDALNEGIGKGREAGLKEGMEKGIEKGIEQRDRQIVLRMLAKGFAVDDISEATGLDAQQIESLRRPES